MGNRRDFGREDDSTYDASQVESVLDNCDVEVVGETTNDFLAYCPYHGNRHTPSFSVSKTSGKFICFNASCARQGSLVELVKYTTKRNEFAARRMILKLASAEEQSFSDKLAKILEKKPEFTEFSQDKIDLMVKNFWENQKAVDYMVKERGFLEETLRTYKIGYSAKKNVIAVPMHDASGMAIGVIGRPASATNKAFKNSRLLHTSKTLWNLHRAKRAGGTVIVCESSFDAMRISQAGYPNVVACLGGHVSPFHFEQLARYFDTIIIMTDFDKKEKHMYSNCRKCQKRGFKLCIGHNPGRDLGATIAAGLRNKRVLWAMYDPKNATVYPHDAKDAGDMTDEEIRQCIQNAVSDFTYQSFGLY